MEHDNNNNNEAAVAQDMEVCDSFEDMDLPDNVLRGVFAMGYERPSVIQRKAILPMRTDRDLIAQAQSGTGKTGAFVIGSLAMLDLGDSATQVLMLSPTRELALQTTDVVSCIGAKMAGLAVQSLVGGTPVREDIALLRRSPPHVVVGCPGRVLHMIGERALDVRRVRILVIDEADELLALGFETQLADIVASLPKATKLALFSATMPAETLRVTETLLRAPLRISLRPDEVTLEGILQYHVALERDSYKAATLLDLYAHISVQQSVIFCNTRRRVEELAGMLREHDHAAAVIHGEMSFPERLAIMREFRAGNTRVLIATDIVARGIDVQTVSLVLNYDLPRDKANYVHRIGRGGRFGRSGVAINFVVSPGEDVATLRELEAFYCIAVEPLPADLRFFN